MKVFFSCPTYKILEYEAVNRLILSEIKKAGHELTRDWFDDEIHLAKTGKAGKNRKVEVWELYDEVIESLFVADVCIFHITPISMSVGHLITRAVENRKPCLVVGDSKENDQLSTSLMLGHRSGFLSISQYDGSRQLLTTLHNFFAKESHPHIRRIDIELGHKSKTALEFMSRVSDLSQVDVVRDAIDANLNKS